MSSVHTVFLAVGLFALTFMSPGPNLLVVVQTSLAQGRVAGMAAGLGVATGDAIYAALGLFGMAALISAGGVVFSAIKIVGGAYLIWFAFGMMRGGRRASDLELTASVTKHSYGTLFRRGLLTDLANPQTVLFFASIFSVTLTASTSWFARLATWLGIVIASVMWRVVISHAFSHPAIRRGYLRLGSLLERIVGVALAGFGARLIYQGLHRH
jgi:amino acid exporter